MFQKNNNLNLIVTLNGSDFMINNGAINIFLSIKGIIITMLFSQFLT